MKRKSPFLIYDDTQKKYGNTHHLDNTSITLNQPREKLPNNYSIAEKNPNNSDNNNYTYINPVEKNIDNTALNLNRVKALQSRKDSKSRTTTIFNGTQSMKEVNNIYQQPQFKLFDNYDNFNYFDISGVSNKEQKNPLQDEYNDNESFSCHNNNNNLTENLQSPRNKIFSLANTQSINVTKISNPSSLITFKGNNSIMNSMSPNEVRFTNSNMSLNHLKNYYTSRKSTSKNDNVKMINNEICEKKVEFNLAKVEEVNNYDYMDDIELNIDDFEDFPEQTENINKSFIPNYLNSIPNDCDQVMNGFTFPLNKIIKHDKLNPVQEQCFDLLYKTNLNSVITSPTGSGKTTLFEIAIGRVIDKFFDRELNKFLHFNFKIVYLAPMKSLCQEKFLDWKLKFNQHPFGLSVIEATGDSEYINMSQLTNANIILSTPERWDIITRKWKDNPQVIQNLNLLLIDEVHLLNEEQRGATLEAIIARMKLISTLPQFKNSEIRNYRTIALSATIPNLKELSEFLEVDLNKGMKSFGEEFRPVKIEKLVFGYNMAKNCYLFEKYLNYRLADLIAKYSDNRPSLIFCQTQKGTVTAATQLLNDISKLNFTHNNNMKPAERMELINISQRIKDKVLSNLVKNGIAFHNASLIIEDRQIVEDTFKRGLIRSICTTSTLAQGVNLPARLVIIKSTYCYRGPKVGYNEYNKMEIDQMVGRAGRPQYDTKGVAIIMTEKGNVEKYIDLTAENQAIESHLKDHIIEHINAEITQGSITDVESAIKWLKYTFMYIRMMNHPEKYNIRKQINGNIKDQVDDNLQKMCVKFFNDLKDVQLITLDNINGNSTTTNNISCTGTNLNSILANPTKLGKKMSKNYVFFETLKNVVNISGNNEETILDVLSMAFEFSKYHSKMEDRKTLNQFNKEEISIKYKIKGPIDTANKKVFILLQAALSGFNIDVWELRRQQSEILNSSGRILNCLKEFFKLKNDAKGYVNCLLLRKALNQKMWSDSDLLIKQLPKIGEKIARNFVKAGITNFEKIVSENPRKIEAISGKNAPFGNVLIDLVKSIPTIEFKYEILKNFKNMFKFQMTFNLQWKKFTHQDDFDPYSNYHAVVIEQSTNSILFKKKLKPNNKNTFFNIPNLTSDKFPIQVYLICDKFFGWDRVHFIAHVDDKEGMVSNQNISCTGQTTLYQMYPDRINVKTNLQSNLLSDNVKSIDEEIDDVIRRCEQEIDEKEKPNKEKKKKEKNKKQEDKNIKSMIENMKNSEPIRKSSNIQRESNTNVLPRINQSASDANLLLNKTEEPVNNFVGEYLNRNEGLVSRLNTNTNTNTNTNANTSNFNFNSDSNTKTNISFRQGNYSTTSQFQIGNKNNNIDLKIEKNVNIKKVEETSEFEFNLDFLDNYKYVGELSVTENTRIKPNPITRPGFNFDDII